VIGRIIHTARILSLDITAGACVCTLFIAKFLKVALPVSCVLALGICIWLIYTTDHLIDAWRIKHQAHSARHYFHQKYFKTITVFFLLFALGSASLLFALPKEVIQWGIVLILLVGAYFLLLFYLRPTLLFQKELAAAILYTGGIFLAPVSLSEQPFTESLLIIFIQFLFIALINLITFSLFEKEVDQADGHSSLVKLTGTKLTRRLLTGLGMIVTSSSLFFIITLPMESSLFKVELLLFGMALTLLGMVMKPSIFRRNEMYRVIGDSIFFYPLLMWLF
jgi:hypothetical protein